MCLNLFSEETLRGPILVGECLPPPQRPLCIAGGLEQRAFVLCRDILT